eukprot:gene11475-15369_t
MSWSASHYDENPFADAANSVVESKNSLPQAAPTKLETPPWLLNSSSGSNNVHNNIPVPANTGTTAEPNSTSVDPAVPRMILYTRVANLLLSIAMIIVSLLSLLTTQNATTGVLACYVVVFSCLLCCFETHLKQISKIIALNFGFMYSAKSRSLFMIFVGTILFSFSLFGKILGIAMLVNAGFNIFILFRYPGYDEMQRNDAQSEIKDYLAANPAFANYVFKTGAEIVASNPEIAKQGVQSMFGLGASTKQKNDSKGDYAAV